MEKRRVDDLIAYLDRLIALNTNDYRTTREIANCLTEIQRELTIGPWDRAEKFEVAAGFSQLIVGPASINVLPRGDR
ncbi:hypothetical protein [Brevibacillus porteri]|uniref:hypothetical protein n=1 Tax=Brevibacillus porteri TaxID=2126350 RepID=UPI003D25A257